jgi:hypothetical protein
VNGAFQNVSDRAVGFGDGRLSQGRQQSRFSSALERQRSPAPDDRVFVGVEGAQQLVVRGGLVA